MGQKICDYQISATDSLDGNGGQKDQLRKTLKLNLKMAQFFVGLLILCAVAFSKVR
jgi:hypothetical protein